MADTALTGLPAASAPDADDLFYIVEDGVSVKATGTQVATLMASIITPPDIGAGDALTTNSLAQFAATTSAELRGVLSDETGTGSAVFATSPTLVTPALGTPSALVLTNATGLPVAGGGTGVNTLTAYAPIFGGTTGTGAVQSGTVGTAGQVLTSNGAGALPTFQAAAGGGDAQTANPLSQFAATTSAQLAGVISDETGSGALVFGTSPTLVTPALGTPSALVLTNATGLPPSTVQGTGLDVDAAGFRGIPQNAQTGNYTTVAADAGKHIFHASGAGAGDTYTIDSNSNVAYEIGTTITFVNLDSNDLSIAITSDTLTLADAGTTGTRTLGQNGVATALKVAPTTWLISGSGLT